MSLRIFANHELGRGPARPAAPFVPELEPPPPAVPVIRPITTEDTILAILRAPRGTSTIEEMFRRKEAQLVEVFRALGPNEARVLLHRVENPAEGDVLATELSRLVIERRQRLLAVLAAAPRRVARCAS